MASSESNTQQEIVPDSVIPHGDLPPLRYRDLPESVSLRRMVGPGIILAGLALGSGEFVLWPKITFLSGFVFFWACVLGVTTQFFLNMEITRWTLATGESVITGFCRLNRRWAGVFLLLNTIPWMIPAWAEGSAHMMGWLIWGEAFQPNEWSMVWLSIGGLVLCGVILTAGPVLYETVERIQLVMVMVIMILVIVMAIAVVRTDAIVAQLNGLFSIQLPDPGSEVSVTMLLGAIAFAGLGGTLNLSQSNYIKDKGYGMGKYIGRITSPITGQQEAISEVGYHFHHTDENLARWKRWWKMANIEHFFSFFVTCLICLVLLTLISYSLFYQPDGELRPDAGQYQDNMEFVWGEAQLMASANVLGPMTLGIFLIMGITILLTTEFALLDAVSRVSTDVVKVNWVRENERWSEGRLYYVFLWGMILLGAAIILLKKFGLDISTFGLFVLSAALNGVVMFLFSILLLIMNFKLLPRALRANWFRVLVLVWSILFFGFFTVMAGKASLSKIFPEAEKKQLVQPGSKQAAVRPRSQQAVQPVAGLDRNDRGVGRG